MNNLATPDQLELDVYEAYKEILKPYFEYSHLEDDCYSGKTSLSIDVIRSWLKKHYPWLSDCIYLPDDYINAFIKNSRITTTTKFPLFMQHHKNVVIHMIKHDIFIFIRAMAHFDTGYKKPNYGIFSVFIEKEHLLNACNKNFDDNTLGNYF